tara:strand:+ start:90 stop:632 length:543 start_codon:yes stop_codon:yes gene_type:complete
MNNESTLIKKVKNSDEDAFQILFNEFHDSLFRFIAYKVQDGEIAQDITQETFFRIWKNRKNLKAKKSFFSLLARISTNLCYDYFRHKAVRTKHKDQIPEFGKSHFDNPEEITQAIAIEKIIKNLIDEKLPEKCKIIFIMNRIDGLSNQEIANKLNLSHRTVENQVYRALKILRSHLEKYL